MSPKLIKVCSIFAAFVVLFESEATLLNGADEKADLSKVKFYLHTNENPSDADELFLDDSLALENSHFHIGGLLWVLIHGYSAGIGGTFPHDTGMDLLEINAQGNAIIVDWSELSAGPNYVVAVQNAYAVSNYTARFLQFLVEAEVVNSNNIHLIGFSLGGQVVGITGKRFQWLTGESVGRVTGLDPAWPLFALAEPDDRISEDDALFVDVVHTNGGTQGVILASGNIDFYPNGGVNQPGCGIDITGACAHARAAQLFKESITSTVPFRSCQCENWDEFDSDNCPCTETANFGYFVDQRATGNFYLRTNSASPFAQG